MAFFKFRKGADAKVAPPNSPAESVDVMRRRAKHRLLGTAVLVLVAVVGFPILFETQPRPVAVDIPIDIPDKNKVKPLVNPAVPPAAATAAGAVDTAPAVPAASAAPAAPAAAKALVAAPSAPAIKASAVPAAASLTGKEEIVGDKAPAKPEPRASQPAPKLVASDDGAKAKALLDGKPTPPASAPDGRFVVQVGAFADSDKAKEARLKLERAGLKTYAQVVETKDGKRTRVRLGPFANRAQAEEAAAKAKAISLPAAILAL